MARGRADGPAGKTPREARISREDEGDAAREAAGEARIARVALIVASMAFALSVLGLFLPIR